MSAGDHLSKKQFREEPDSIRYHCEHCGNNHQAHYSHDSPYGGHKVYEGVCTKDNLSDYYTAEAAL